MPLKSGALVFRCQPVNLQLAGDVRFCKVLSAMPGAVWTDHLTNRGINAPDFIGQGETLADGPRLTRLTPKKGRENRSAVMLVWWTRARKPTPSMRPRRF